MTVQTTQADPARAPGTPGSASPGETARDSAAAAPAIRAVGLGRFIDDRALLDAVTFDLPVGSYLALLGPNGAGKTTLLHALATLTPVTHGTLELFGQPVKRNPGIRARIGMIGHQSMLYRDLSALENLLFFGRLYDVADPDARATHLLEQVGLIDRRDDRVGTFSRGMVQRVAIARALMHEPDLLLADEPFAGLDVPSTLVLESMLASLHEAGKTIVLANHDIAQTLKQAGRVLLLRRGHVVLDKPTSAVSVDDVTKELSQP